MCRRGKGESGDVDMLVLAKEERLKPDVVINQLVDAIKKRTEVGRNATARETWRWWSPTGFVDRLIVFFVQ